MDLLPEELHGNVALFLSAPDILSLLSVNPRIHNGVGKSSSFWSLLLSRDIDGVALTSNDPKELRRAYLLCAHTTLLPSVKWCRVKNILGTRQPSAREGHLMCLLGPPANRKIVLTGGYSDDDSVHYLEWNAEHTGARSRRWSTLQPVGRPPSFTYGSTLTSIDDTHALRFGGFRAGGYSAETADCFLLTFENGSNGNFQAKWEKINTEGPQPSARAYHSTTLINDRYLLVLGGMKANNSILDEALLDVKTWTWMPSNSITDPLAEQKPSPRHGHSVVLDSRRNRLVLFGGGDGSDLLRSGTDNSEVWEFKLGESWTNDLVSSLPWRWRRIHRDSRAVEDELDDNSEARPELSRAERLCLGRCHLGFQTSTDTVVFAFGSGRPSTNGILAYNLRTDAFHRPRVHGPLPEPRFTCAAVLHESWLVAHGGYAANGQGAIGDMVVLDLAPGMRRTFPTLEIAGESDQEMLETHEAIRDEDVRYNQDTTASEMLLNLMATRRGQRQNAAVGMLHQLMAGGGMGGQEAYFLAMIANGNSEIRSDDSSEEEFTDNEAGAR